MLPFRDQVTVRPWSAYSKQASVQEAKVACTQSCEIGQTAGLPAAGAHRSLTLINDTSAAVNVLPKLRLSPTALVRRRNRLGVLH